MSESERPPRLFWQYWPVVWLAGWLAPANQRAQWRSRRRAELWHWAAFLSDPQRRHLASKKDFSQHCWQAWPEALWLRYSREPFLHNLEIRLRAPGTCLWACVVLLALVIAASGLLPVTRSVALPLPIPEIDHVGTVQYAGGWWSVLRNGVLDTWTEKWAQQPQVVSGVAEFSFDWHTVSTGGAARRVVAAQVSPNFFDVLGVAPAAGRLFRAGDISACPQCVVVSDEFWSQALGRNRSVLGKQIILDGMPAIVAGVLPARFWFMAREIGIWAIAPPPPPPVASPLPAGLQMLVTDHEGHTYAVAPQPANPLPQARLVAAVVRLNPRLTLPEGERAMLEAIRPLLRRPAGRIEINPLDRQRHAMVYPYGVAMLAAVLITLVAAGFRFTQPLRQFNQQRAALRWWSFLAIKSLLLLLAAALAALELTPIFSKSLAHGMDPSAWGLAVWLCLVLCVAVLMWSLHDQRYRCPVCLSRLALPVLVGEHGRLLLGSGATEFVCSGGHSIMHVSDFATSWIDAESWTHLDESWRTLFTPEEKKE